jgi:hypothetical protein
MSATFSPMGIESQMIGEKMEIISYNASTVKLTVLWNENSPAYNKSSVIHRNTGIIGLVPGANLTIAIYT